MGSLRASSVVAVSLVATVAWAVATAQETLPPLETARVDAHLLRVENAQLRAHVARLEAELASARLTAERLSLEADLRAVLKPPADWVFDWSRRVFMAPPKEPK